MNKWVIEAIIAMFIVMGILPALYSMFSTIIPDMTPMKFITISIFATVSPIILFYLFGYDKIKKIIVSSIETWSETHGSFLSTTTTHYAKINGKYKTEITTPFDIRKGNIVYLGKNKLGMKKIILDGKNERNA
jgi:hypothetical protein